MLCNKKHKAQESCSSEKYEKNPFKTTYLFQHILERQESPRSLSVTLCAALPRECLCQAQHSREAPQTQQGHPQRAVFITRHLNFPLPVKIKEEHLYFSIFSLSKGQSAGFSGAAQVSVRLPPLLLLSPAGCCTQSTALSSSCGLWGSFSAWGRHLRKIWLSILLFLGSHNTTGL